MQNCNEAKHYTEELRKSHPLEMFNFENKLDKVFLELLLFLQNLSLDEGHVIKEIFEFGILVILENYLTHFEEVDTVII